MWLVIGVSGSFRFQFNRRANRHVQFTLPCVSVLSKAHFHTIALISRSQSLGRQETGNASCLPGFAEFACTDDDTPTQGRVNCLVQCYEVCLGTRRPATRAVCVADLNRDAQADARNMRVARHRPAIPTTPGQSAYFQELEPFSSKPHPGGMHLFRHTNVRGSTSDSKVARRSHSTHTRPQGVLDLMENSWYVFNFASNNANAHVGLSLLTC